VSGLALGIDGAAHAGALAARAAAPEGRAGPPVGVVAGGLDRPYPARHRILWREVAAAGVLFSEAPLGTTNESWRFPARNRILAALADVIVVVESHASGGSMITADQGLLRGKTVLAVPGPIRSPSSAGSNRLFSEGAGPACDTADILAALALARPMDGPGVARRESNAARDVDTRPAPDPLGAAVLAAVDWAPTATETVLARTELSPGDVAARLATLEIDGWVRGASGWWERLGPGPPPSVGGGLTLD
jgi:DNA processing protein